jgi:hypothetical protein
MPEVAASAFKFVEAPQMDKSVPADLGVILDILTVVESMLVQNPFDIFQANT